MKKTRNGIPDFGFYDGAMTKSLHTPQYEHFRLLMVLAREQAGLTQAQVANMLNKPQSFVSKYEMGERRIDIVEFVQLCRVIGIDPLSIFNAINEKI